jgi:23S rRNA (cytosine1962-C5)-methyltransferase
MEPAVVKALNTFFNPKEFMSGMIYPCVELEGMAQQKGFLSNSFSTEIIINENGLRFYVDIETGQKTAIF